MSIIIHLHIVQSQCSGRRGHVWADLSDSYIGLINTYFFLEGKRVQNWWVRCEVIVSLIRHYDKQYTPSIRTGCIDGQWKDVGEISTEDGRKLFGKGSGKLLVLLPFDSSRENLHVEVLSPLTVYNHLCRFFLTIQSIKYRAVAWTSLHELPPPPPRWRFRFYTHI